MKLQFTKRSLSFIMAVIMLVSFTVPAFAFDDLSEVTNVTDYGDTSEVQPPEITAPDNGEGESSSSSSSESDTSSSQLEENPSSDSSSSETSEVLPEEPQKETADLSVGTSGVDPPYGIIPDGYSFTVDSGSPNSRARSSSATAIYVNIDNFIQHRYPFNGGTSMYPAYIFSTVDGQTAYCIEPAKWNSVNNDMVTGSITYSGLSHSQQVKIAKAIAANPSGAGNHAKYMAAQAIIWQIVYGENFGSGSVYDAVIAANSAQLSSAYHEIISKMEAGGEIPSFMSSDKENATLHEMTEGGGQWTIDLTNTNSKVTLNASDFKSREPLQFSASGNTLTVTSSAKPGNDSFTEWHSNGGSTGLVFWVSPNGTQGKVTGAASANVPGDGYMAFNADATPPPDEPDITPEQGLGYLQINKYDGKTNLPLGGAIFKVECDGFRNDAFPVEYGGSTIVIPIPEEQGSVQVTVTEVKAPEGYAADSAPKTVTVTKNETVNIAKVAFANLPLECSLTIYKHETGNKAVPLAGATFKIRYADIGVSAQSWTLTTDANGEITIDLPAAGTLIIEELSAPMGYVIGSISTHDVTVIKGEHKRIDIGNDKRAELVVVKRDAQSAQTLAGAVIKATLIRAHTPPYEQNISYTQTTGADGRAVFGGLIPGSWRVEEIQPPQYYQGTSEVHTVSIFEGNTAPVTVEFKNEPWTGLTIKKVDATNDKGLQGAVFKLYKGSEEDPLAFLGDFESGPNGVVVIPKLESDQYYTIVEAQPPYGYLIDTEHHVQTIRIKPDAIMENITVIFRNPPKPKLLIEKIDQKTGAALPGAVFRVALKDSAEYKEFTTGADGTVLIENLDENWYTVTEIRSPTGYILDSTVHNVQLKAGETTRLSVNNHRMPNLTIRKVDEQTGEGLVGVTLRVTKDGATEFQDVTTGANGVFVLKNVTPGWFVITELHTLDSHILDTTPHYIEVKPGEDTEIVITNKAKPSLKIIKTDSVTKQPMQGVSFNISIKNGKNLGDYTTDKNGEIFLPNAETNLYVVKEVKTPDGYLIDTQSKEVLVEWGKAVVVEFTNTPKNPLLVKKVDAKTGEPLAGAKFVVQKVNGELVGEYETGRNGYITVTGIEPGFYTVKETKAPLGYILDDTPKTVELKYDEPAIVEFENQPLNGLHLLKVDSKTKAPLAGAKFRISEKGGKEVGTYTTDGQGEILVDGLEPGWYTCEEISAPAGYRLDNAPKDIEFVWGQLTTVEFENELLSPIQIKKVDEETGAPLAGALFKITRANGEFVGEFSSGADGFINVPELSPGFYIVSEQRAPDGYLLDSTPKTIEVKANVPTLVEFTNKRMPGVQVRKLDKVSGEPIGGARFRVTKMDGELVGDFQTNSAGFFIVPEQNLNNEWITVYETRAAAGYILDPTPQNVQLKPGKTAIVEFLNQPLVGLQIKKVDDVTGLPMGGVQFKVSELDGRSIGSFTTDDTGLIFVPNLKSGAWVIVEEVKTLPGYRLDNAPRNVEIKGDRLNILEYRNQPFPNLLIKKVDAETGKALEGVKFKLYDKLNRELGVFTTSQLGQIHLTGMEAGTYYLQEVEAKPGYVLDATVREISLLWGKTTTIEVKNTPMGTLRVKKIDAISKKPIYGVTFNLYDLKNNLLGEYTTDNNGIIEFPKEITAGKYKLKEVRAAANYVLDDVPRTIEVKAGETMEIVIENQPVLGNIQIIKKSAEYNDISKKGKGAYLAGAVFEIFDSRNKIVDRITTDSRGIATSKDLPAGEVFGIREITAPDYYLLNEQVFYAEVKKPNDIIQFEVLDANEKISVNVEKYGNIECMPGDVIRYDFKEISNTSTVPLDDFYWRDTIPTDAVRIEKIYTGTWSEHLDYKVLYKTNRRGWRTLEDDIYSGSADTLDCSRSALRLGANEVITEIKFEFGTVQAGFEQVDAPYILCSVNGDLANEYRFTNKTDVGGKRADEWVIAKDSWVTIVYAKPRGKLPLTGK